MHAYREKKTLRRLAVAFVLAISFVARTATAQIAVLGGTVEERAATSGETYIGTLVIKNLTDVAQPVRLYQTDYTFTAEGTSRFDKPGTNPRSNANWITPSASSVTLPPSGEITISYAVRVPALDTLSGTYWSTMMVEGETSSAPRPSAKQRIGIAAVMRYAIQIATNIADSGTRTVAFSEDRLVPASPEGRALEINVRNTGTRGYRPKMWVEVYDSAGALKVRVEQQRGLLFPGTALKQSFMLGRMAPGHYKAIVFSDTGDDAISAAQYTLSF